MKNTSIISIILVLIVVVPISSCTSSSKPGKIFVGEWKRIDQPEEEHLVIERAEGAFIIFFGKNKLIALFNEDQHVIKSFFLGDSVTIKYAAKTDHILMDNNGGEFTRVK